MLRPFTYVILGWLLLALCGGLADVLALTIVLPSTSAVILAHAAWGEDRRLVPGLAVAVGLGYLEDLHQGAPVGALSLSFGVAYLLLHWAAGRLAVRGWPMRALMALLAVVLVDAVMLLLLFALADTFGIRTEALLGTLPGLRWHALATALVGPPVWTLLDRTFAIFRLDDRPPPPLNLEAR